MGNGSDDIEVLTIGHSAHPPERFIALLRGADVTAVADVRSAPYSRYSPQFNQAQLRDELGRAGIAYVFLGRELGGRPAEREFFGGGVAGYERMAQGPGKPRGGVGAWVGGCAPGVGT